MGDTDNEPGAKLQFRKALHFYRERASISQDELAGRVGKSQQWLAKVERGEQSLKLEDAQALADAIDVPFRVFMAFAGEGSTADLLMTRGQIAEAQREAKKNAAAAGRRSDELGQTISRLRSDLAQRQAELDMAVREQNRAEYDRSYWGQRFWELGHRLATITGGN